MNFMAGSNITNHVLLHSTKNEFHVHLALPIKSATYNTPLMVL